MAIDSFTSVEEILPSRGALLGARISSHTTFAIGAGVVLVIFAVALSAPWLAPHDPSRVWDPAAGRLLPPGSARLAVSLADGRTALAEAVRPAGPSTLAWKRLGVWQQLPVASVVSVKPVAFPLGTDRYGRDLASRLLLGARVSLRVGLAAVGLALLVVGKRIGPVLRHDHAARIVGVGHSFPWARASRSTCSTRAL